MNIVSYNYEKIIKNVLENMVKDFGRNMVNKFLDDNSFKNYQNVINNISTFTYEMGKELLTKTFEFIDEWYFNNPHRDNKRFVSKGKRERTLVTSLGEITYNRRTYKDTTKKKGDIDYHFTYVDRYLQLPKRIKYDPSVIALTCEYASDLNSLIKVGKTVSDLVAPRFDTRDNKRFFVIGRQQVSNMLKRAALIYVEPLPDKLPTPETIYIEADEKFIHNQREAHDNTMVKSTVTFENVVPVYKTKRKKSSPNRKKLKNRFVIASNCENVWEKTLDYINNVYDIEKIKTIHIFGDGAKWIKAGKNEMKFDTSVKVINNSDKFHPAQYINHITKDEVEKKILRSYMIHNKKKAFILLGNALKIKYKERSDIIESKLNYLLNNWTYIQNAYKLKIGCSMESHISHILASQFTSVPKGYRDKNSEFLIQLRCLKENCFNVRNVIMDLFDNQTVTSPTMKVYNNSKNSNITIINKGQRTFNYKQLMSISHPIHIN